MADFGGGSTEKNHNLIKSVMEKTGAKIEMSSSKDQSLTFLISGKQETVLKARRELLVQFQTQASMSIAIPKEHHRYVCYYLNFLFNLGEKLVKTLVRFFKSFKKSKNSGGNDDLMNFPLHFSKYWTGGKSNFYMPLSKLGARFLQYELLVKMKARAKKIIIFFFRTNRSLIWLHGCGYHEQDYPRVEHFIFIVSYHKAGQKCIKEAGCCISTFT